MKRAQQLNERIEVLTFTETAPDTFAWVPTGKAWAAVERSGKRALFSVTGTAQEEYLFTLRRGLATETQAFRLDGRFVYIGGLYHPDRGHTAFRCMFSDPHPCTVQRSRVETNELNNPTLTVQAVLSFPGLLSEKYAGFLQGEVHDTISHTLVLVVPKAVELHVGEVVTIGDLIASNGQPMRYYVQVAHVLDANKNEYEITREADASCRT